MALHILNASNEGDFDRVFRTVVQLQAGALVVAPDALFTDQREQVAALAKHYAVPTMYELRDFVEAGGLISYGANALDQYRLIPHVGATYARPIAAADARSDAVQANIETRRNCLGNIASFAPRSHRRRK